MAVRDEPEVMAARRAWAKSQELLAGVPLRTVSGALDVGWHDSAVEEEQGATAVVAVSAELDDLIGEVLRVSCGGRAIFVYVLGSRAVPTPLSVARHAFFPTLGLLTHESLSCRVEVVE